MPKRNRTSVDVDLCGVQAGLSNAREALGSKASFNSRVEIRRRDAGPGQCLLGRRYRTDAHVTTTPATAERQSEREV